MYLFDPIAIYKNIPPFPMKRPKIFDFFLLFWYYTLFFPAQVPCQLGHLESHFQ